MKSHPDLRIMSSSQLRQLRDEGVTIAAHGWFHSPLTGGVENAVLEREIADSKSSLENLLTTTVDHFVFPHGLSSTASIKMLKKIGYRSGLTTRAGCVQPSSDRYTLPRIAAECTLSHLRSQLLRLSA
jgi:peptidoglycan/xylan/chitin deacetylase (PgdA/CDA1 family)